MPFQHRDLTGSDAVHPAWYVQSTDPGAVGAHKGWVDTSTAAPYQLKKRNAANSAWENVGVISASLFSDAEGNPANLSGTSADGTSTFAARRDHVHGGFSDSEGNPADVLGTGVADGTSNFAARRDHVHELGIITTRGDLIRGGVSGVPERRALGTAGHVWTSDGTDADWAAPTGGGGGGGGGSGALVPIQVVGPLTASQPTISFTAPLTGFRNLRIVYDLRCDDASGNEQLLVRFNNDSGNNYDRVLDDSGGAVATTNQSAGFAGYIANASHTSGFSSSGFIDIPNYANLAFHKNFTSFTRTPSLNRTNYTSSTWKSTAAITTITLLPQTSTDFIAGSYACLYGEMDTAGVLLTPASNLLYETTLLSATATIDTGTLSQAYRDLRVEISGVRGDTAATETTLRMRFNGDSGSNYDSSSVRNSNTTVTGIEQNGAAQFEVGLVTANNATAGAASGATIDIPGYTGTTFWKTANGILADSIGSGAGNRRVIGVVGFWRNTAAITSIQFTLAAGNFSTGAAVRVYGEPISTGASSVGTGTRLRISANQSITTATASLINWDTEDADADNQHYTSNANLTGTVAKSTDQFLIGSGTAFLTELSVGQVIAVPGTATEKRVIIAINSDTLAVVNSPFVNTASGQTATRVNSAVVFRQPGFYACEANIYSAALSTGAVTLAMYVNNLTTATSGTPIAQSDPTAINASAGYSLVAERPFQMWDFVEVVWTQNSGGNVNVLTDERTHFAVNARPTVIVAVPYVNIQDQKAQNTAGGTFTSGADQTRVLNTIVSDTAGMATLASNQIALPPGRWRYHIKAPAFACEQNQAWLHNITTSAVVQRGSSERAGGAGNTTTSSFIIGVVTLSTSTVLEVRHRCNTTRSTDGFGVAANFGTEVYTVAEFWKEG